MTQTNTKLIFSIYYAADLIELGHKVIKTVRNPVRPDLMAWVFEIDDTFEEDFNKVRDSHMK